MDETEVSLSVRNEEDDLSPECLAWADSCINNSPDDSENWETFRDALTEIIDIHPEIFVPVPSSSTVTTRRSVLSQDTEMTETEESIDTRNLELEADLSNSSNEEVTEIVSLLTFESNPSKTSLQDHYFPESNETRESVNNPTIDLEENGSVSNEEAVEEGVPELLLSQAFKDDFMSGASIQEDGFNNVTEEDLSVKVIDQQEIFKVWDLEIDNDDDDQEEEDGLVLQLKKALDESSSAVQPLPQLLNDDHVGSIDDLIAGISDLSLTETF